MKRDGQDGRTSQDSHWPSVGADDRNSSGKLLIGREEDCHLRSTSEFVSRHHCVLLLDEYTLRIRDLGSQNGTFVNGRRIVRGELILLHGDAVSVGDLDFQIDCAQASPEDPPVRSESPPAALQGTGVFDGETLRGNSPDARPQTPSSTPTGATS